MEVITAKVGQMLGDMAVADICDGEVVAVCPTLSTETDSELLARACEEAARRKASRHYRKRRRTDRIDGNNDR